MPSQHEGRTRAQATMEWRPLIRIYESRLWRRGPFFNLMSGLTFERESALIHEAADLAPQDAVLDLACGPGLYARRFARRVIRGRVIGFDLSAPMLEAAVRKRDAEGLRNLALVRGSAMDLPFHDARFDAVNCCGALHLFPDPRHVLGEVARVLRPGGRFSMAAYRHGPSAWAARASRRREEFAGIRAFSPAELATWFEEIGLVDPRCLHEARTWLIMSARKPANSGASEN